ncbi:hypothetical protein [Carboxylicivirga marina]|uniref:Uncharacterized protein n=1 Tax=Carboxylicivirga marina TaxID=2800988 RepID=A0ABS1HPK4_9BACT|nr:hypothetical protein [Carboxylicivirga marina]MBK3519521.1 hypothetical protein [Carboxylicivirga marina]
MIGKIKQITILLVVCLTMDFCQSTSRTKRADVVLPLIPQPQNVLVYEGSFVLDASTEVITSNREQNNVAS